MKILKLQTSKKVVVAQFGQTQQSGLPNVDLHGLSHYDACVAVLDYLSMVIDDPDNDSLTPFYIIHGKSKWMKEWVFRVVSKKRFIIDNQFVRAGGNDGASQIVKCSFDDRLPPMTPEQRQTQREKDLKEMKTLMLPKEQRNYNPVMELIKGEESLFPPHIVKSDKWQNDELDLSDDGVGGSLNIGTWRHMSRVRFGYWDRDVDWDGVKTNIGDLVKVHPELWNDDHDDYYQLDAGTRVKDQEGDYVYDHENVSMMRSKTKGEVFAVVDKMIQVKDGGWFGSDEDGEELLHDFILIRPVTAPHITCWFRFEQVKVVSSA